MRARCRNDLDLSFGLSNSVRNFAFGLSVSFCLQRWIVWNRARHGDLTLLKLDLNKRRRRNAFHQQVISWSTLLQLSGAKLHAVFRWTPSKKKQSRMLKEFWNRLTICNNTVQVWISWFCFLRSTNNREKSFVWPWLDLVKTCAAVAEICTEFTP